MDTFNNDEDLVLYGLNQVTFLSSWKTKIKVWTPYVELLTTEDSNLYCRYVLSRFETFAFAFLRYCKRFVTCMIPIGEPLRTPYGWHWRQHSFICGIIEISSDIQAKQIFNAMRKSDFGLMYRMTQMPAKWIVLFPQNLGLSNLNEKPVAVFRKWTTCLWHHWYFRIVAK